MTIAHRSGPRRHDGGLKLAFDVVGSALGLVLLLPVLAIVAVIVKLDSRGPIFFRQERSDEANPHSGFQVPNDECGHGAGRHGAYGARRHEEHRVGKVPQEQQARPTPGS